MAGYVYRGIEPLGKPGAPVKRGPKPGPKPFNADLCGSTRGYRQHRIYKQETCPECKAAHRVYDANIRAERKARRTRN
jgi:hypothetical protein